MLTTRPQPKGLVQIGICVVFKRLGTYPAAECTLCAWKTEALYEDDLARQVAAHSRSHEQVITR